MITQAIFDWITNGIIWMLGLFPEVSPDFDAWVNDAITFLGNLADIAQAWGYLVPWQHFVTAFMWTIWAIGFAIGIKLVRIVLSFLTLGGGSAA